MMKRWGISKRSKIWKKTDLTLPIRAFSVQSRRRSIRYDRRDKGRAQPRVNLYRWKMWMPFRLTTRPQSASEQAFRHRTGDSWPLISQMNVCLLFRWHAKIKWVSGPAKQARAGDREFVVDCFVWWCLLKFNLTFVKLAHSSACSCGAGAHDITTENEYRLD